MLLTSPVLLCKQPGEAQDVFSRIYQDGAWGRNSQGEGISGVGSIYKHARPYLRMLQKFLNTRQIRSVVDVGCGDWEISKYIRWEGIQYHGYDVVPSVINKDILKYGSPTVHFTCADGINADLPRADLLICKDVLQHLPNSYIQTLISKLSRFKYCLITNDISAPSVTTPRLNIDIPMGSGRFVDLTKPPFNVKGKKILHYHSPGTNKEVLLICRAVKKAQNSKARRTPQESKS